MQDLEHLESKTILITGGTGDIGSLLTESICRLPNVNIYVLTRKTSSLEKLSNIRDRIKFANYDLVDYNSIESSITQVKPDIIFHLGAQSVVSVGIKNPLMEFDTNVRGTVSILDAARKTDSNVVFASSATVYGNPVRVPVKEDDLTNPISTQGTSKLCCEKYLEVFNRIYGLNSVALRYFNVYGPPLNKRVVYDLYTKLRKTPNELQLFGTGKEEKDYIFSTDVVDATLLSSKLNGFHVFNVGSGIGATVIDLAKLIAKELGLNPKITSEGKPRKGDIQRLVADVSKIERELGWRAKISLEGGVKKTIKWFKTL